MVYDGFIQTVGTSAAVNPGAESQWACWGRMTITGGTQFDIAWGKNDGIGTQDPLVVLKDSFLHMWRAE